MNAILQPQPLNAASPGLIIRQQPSDLDMLLARPWSPRDMLEGEQMGKMEAMAAHLANSKLSVPEHLRGNVGDCLAIVTQAMLWNMNPFAVAQKTHLVNGKLGYEAQLINAVLQNSGAVRSLPYYDYEGDGNSLACRVGFVPAGHTEITWGEWLSMASVTTRNSPLWKTNPKQQLGYLQIKNWARAFAPGAILGVYTKDELESGEADDGAPFQPPPQVQRGPQRKSAAAPATATIGADPDTGEIPPPAASTKAPAPAPTSHGSADVRGSIGPGQVNYLRGKLKAAGIAEGEVCERYGVDKLESLSLDAFDEQKSELLRLG